MNNQIFDAIREALANADESSWTQELHIQVLCTRQISQNPYPIRILPS